MVRPKKKKIKLKKINKVVRQLGPRSQRFLVVLAFSQYKKWSLFFFFFYSHLLHIYTTWLSMGPTQFSFKRACSPSLWLHWSLHDGHHYHQLWWCWSHQQLLILTLQRFPAPSQFPKMLQGAEGRSTAGLTDLSPQPTLRPTSTVSPSKNTASMMSLPTKGLRCLLNAPT